MNKEETQKAADNTTQESVNTESEARHEEVNESKEQAEIESASESTANESQNVESEDRKENVTESNEEAESVNKTDEAASPSNETEKANAEIEKPNEEAINANVTEQNETSQQSNATIEETKDEVEKEKVEEPEKSEEAKVNDTKVEEAKNDENKSVETNAETPEVNNTAEDISTNITTEAEEAPKEISEPEPPHEAESGEEAGGGTREVEPKPVPEVNEEVLNEIMKEVLGKTEEEAEKSHEAEEEPPRETIRIPEDDSANDDYNIGNSEQKHREIINPRINDPKEDSVVESMSSNLMLESAKAEGSSKTYLAVLMFGAFVVGLILYATSKKQEGTAKSGKSSQPQPDEKELKSLIRMEIIN